MTNLDPEFCRKFKEARRNAALSQSMLAKEVGCKQSALSMFEQGDGTKLNDGVIAKLCRKFNMELPKEEKEDKPAVAAPRPAAALRALPHSAFCPNALCPSNLSYFVDGRRFLKPDRAAQDPAGGLYCAVCGELLERHCPSCGAPVHDGAVCTFCGEPYVAVADQ
ncbi:MAG: helix-turn-helix domain-containing protein [Kiritimatiellae bacterium]|nr:helix-turn-helix domain-containing protein [Kiritimatiellia bacterium]